MTDHDASLTRRVRIIAASRPGAPAVRVGHTVWSYMSLLACVDQLACDLRQRGVGEGDRIGVLCAPGMEALTAMLAANHLGAAFVPMDADVPANRVAFVGKDSQLSYLLTQSKLRSDLLSLSGAGHAVVLGDGLDLIAIPITASKPEGAGKFAIETPHRETAAYVIYTSGSTGKPKGVVVSRQGLASYLDACLDMYGSPEWGDSLVGSSLAVDLTITGLFLPLLRGACSVMLDGRDVHSRWLDGIRAARGSAFVKIAPTQLNLILPHVTQELAGKVAVMVIGGEALEWKTVRQWKRLSAGTRIFNEYGPTEAVVGCVVHEVNDTSTTNNFVPIGVSLRNSQAHVLDSHFSKVEMGELWISGEGLAQGYAGRPGVTAAKFVPDPFGAPGGRLYRTGDLVRSDGGVLNFLGRRDNQVKIRGFRVELGEVESTLASYPGVSAAAVALESDPRSKTDSEIDTPQLEQRGFNAIRRFTKPESNEAQLVGYIVLQKGTAVPTDRALRKWMGERLPLYMLPAAFVIVPVLPVLPGGKLNRAALRRELGRLTPHGTSGGAPRNEIEQILCDILSETLNLAAVGIHDGFFEIGGDSIRVIGIHAKARARGLSLELGDFFQHPTVAELAKLAAERDGAVLKESGLEPETNSRAPDSKAYTLLTAEDLARLPQGIEDAYPLSKMQAGLIFHSQESETSANYHDVFVYAVGSIFCEKKISAALDSVVKRHPALRTSFALAGFSEPLQLVWEGAQAEFVVNDLRELDADAQHEALRNWVAAEKERPFDFAHAPLLRLHVHRTADHQAHWGVSFHDSILDGWSVATFLLELLSAYSAQLISGEPELAPLTSTYRDFVKLEREVLRDDSQATFWTQYLNDRTTAHLQQNEPTGGAQPHLVEVRLSAQLSDQLEGVARLLRVPVKHVLLAAHVHVVSLMTGRVDVVTGLETHGRPEGEGAERTLGMHLNTIPLRVRLGGGTWSDLIEAVHASERATFPYRRFPYAWIRKLQPGTAEYSTVFNYTHFHQLRKIATLPGIEPLGGFGFGQRHYALSAEFNKDPYTTRLRADLECNLEAGDEAYWDAVRRAYEQALEAIATDPMDRYEMLPSALAIHSEVQGTDWSRREFSSVLEQFMARVEERPEAAAVIDSGGGVSFSELLEKAESIRRALAGLGVGVEDCVAIYLEPSAEQVAAVWGILAAGAAYTAIEPRQGTARLRHVLDDAGVRVTISDRRLKQQVCSAVPETAWLLIDERASWPTTTSEPAQTVSPRQLAYVMYTSGSSGKAKGVRISHANLAYSTAIRQAYYGQGEIRFLCIPSLAHDSSVAVLFHALCSGGTLIMPTADEVRDPERLGQMIAQHRISHWLSVPALYAALLQQSGPAVLETLRCAIVAGEACPSSLAALSRERCSAELFNEYGPTEATVWATVYRCHGQTNATAKMPIGEAIQGTRLHVLDGHLRPVARGVSGEIYIGGLGVGRGYGSAGATAARFLPDPFATTPGQSLYRTGDLARYHASGQLEFRGRVDRQIKIRGYRVEPGEIEAVLKALNDVEDAVVIALDAHDQASARLLAYVVPSSAGVDIGALRRGCSQQLPASLVPSSFVLIDRLPRLENGKVDVRYLAEVRPGFYSHGEAERLLARVEAMEAREAEVLLRELAVTG